MSKYAHFESGVNMRLSQMLSLLNGLLLSTNVVAITFNTADDLYVPSNEPSQWSYSDTQTSAENQSTSLYFNNEE
jgi:hypothetical protein